MENLLEEYRKDLDEIDTNIAELFEKRMETVLKIAKYKKENNIKTFDPNREAQMKINNSNKLKNANLKKYYLEILDAFLKVSKDFQYDYKDIK